MTEYSQTGGRRILIGTMLIALMILSFALIAPYLDQQYLESQRDIYQQFYQRNPVWTILVYVAIATFCIGLALPVTGISAILAGALFGFPTGVMACSLAGLMGATIVFLWSRYLFRDWLQKRFQSQFLALNRGIEKEGGYYLFSARLLMILPFFMVNIVCGLTSLRLSVYMISTFLSQTIVVSVFVYAGATLASLDSASEVLTPVTFLTLALVGLAPLILHRLIALIYKKSSP